MRQPNNKSINLSQENSNKWPTTFNSEPLIMTNLHLEAIKSDFPILNQKINNYPLVYFDNAATTHKPKKVINKISNYYIKINSNVHKMRSHIVLLDRRFEYLTKLV